MDDIRADIDYLTTLPYVDNERIGAMGVCAGGGYTMSAVQTEMRIKAAAGVCAWNVGPGSGMVCPSRTRMQPCLLP